MLTQPIIPWHAECYVLGGHTSEVEGIQGHLGGRLTDTLGRQGPNHLTGSNLNLHWWHNIST